MRITNALPQKQSRTEICTKEEEEEEKTK